MKKEAVFSEANAVRRKLFNIWNQCPQMWSSCSAMALKVMRLQMPWGGVSNNILHMHRIGLHVLS
eukprot:5020993-Prorocentrum_lima.AAC.1